MTLEDAARLAKIVASTDVEIYMAFAEHNTHPYRAAYLREVSLRGVRLFDSIGWPHEPKSRYVNRYIAQVRTFADITGELLNPAFRPRETINDHLFVLLEHWQPYQDERDTRRVAQAGTQFTLWT